MKKTICLLAVTLFLAGCAAQSEQKGPVGVGGGVNELKRSPCACLQLDQAIPDGYEQSRPQA